MAGISSCGAYIPVWRMAREAIATGLVGEKAVANFDEDGITMAVAAALDCLGERDRSEIDGLFFASTTSPYKERQASSTIAAALDLRRDILTADFANSLRAGTTALLQAAMAVDSGRAKKIMVTTSDTRLGAPGSQFEQYCGDGAAAILVSDSGICASIDDSYSITDEIMDVWRAEGDTFIRSWEDRFIQTEGYLKIVAQATSSLLTKCGVKVQEFAKIAYYAPDHRRHAEMARRLGIDPKRQAQDPLFASVGNTGTAFPLMLLAAALEEAKAGDRILVASYGDGSDTFIVTAADGVEKGRGRRGVKGNIASKKMIPDYRTYLQWRQLLTREVPHRPPIGNLSPPAMWRERDRNLRFHGAKCKACGSIQYPPQRVCSVCHTMDNFEKIRLSDKKGQLFTYSIDYLSDSPDTPQPVAVVNLEGGGRIISVITDRDLSEIKMGMPLEMTFRRLHTVNGIHNYYWKTMASRI